MKRDAEVAVHVTLVRINLAAFARQVLRISAEIALKGGIFCFRARMD
jgi:hypothetical protein